MTLDELNTFIEERDAIMREAKNGLATDRERVLARTVKLFEEAGELCDEILATMGWQRKEKLDAKTPESLGEEFADVLITLFLLAKTLNVDFPAVLNKKIEKIRLRDASGY
jgi:NTP pyrophosphatase (non-canonical NTP hydrolase)